MNRENEHIETDELPDEGEMILLKEIHVDPKQSPLRIDKFLFDRLEGITRNKIQNACEAEMILVDGRAVKSNHKVKPGECIRVYTYYQEGSSEIIPENIPLDIIYEDQDILIVYKPAGMVVHPAIGNKTGTLVHGVSYHLQKQNENKNDLPRIGLVHRIDKNTSGLLAFGKNEEAMFFLAEQFRRKTAQRKYIALVWGNVEEDTGTIRANIGRHKRFRKKFDVYPDGDSGKDAVTHYKVLERFNYTTLIECQLETGRTHQIRVHMQSLGHPIFSDEVYGGDKIVKGTVYSKYKQFVENAFKLCPRQVLHAKTLGIIHPVTKRELFFDSELPEDMQAVIQKWRNYSNH